MNYWSDREVLAVLHRELLLGEMLPGDLNQDKKETADGLKIRRAA
jgi:hypothetical protein